MMNTNSRNRNLLFIIIFLILTNLLVLGYFLFAHRKHTQKFQRDGFETALRKEVGFNDEQLKKFSELKTSNWAQAKNKMEQIKELKIRLFDLIKQQTISDSAITILADSIGMLQKQMEINAFHHFKATRQLCTPQQQPLYDSLMKKILSRQGRPPRSENKR